MPTNIYVRRDGIDIKKKNSKFRYLDNATLTSTHFLFQITFKIAVVKVNQIMQLLTMEVLHTKVVKY